MDAPTGTVTFLFTDIEGSFRLWERFPVDMGPAEYRDHDYFGGTLNRTARISSAGHGGQILVSQVFADTLPDEFPDLRFLPLGEFRLRNLASFERIY